MRTPFRGAPEPGCEAAYTSATMVMRGFERRLERLVEGGFARAFRSAVRPVELGRRLVRTMDDDRTLDVSGQMAAPNSFTLWLAQPDMARFVPMRDALCSELGELAREHARDRGYRFLGNVAVDLAVADYREGQFEVAAEFVAAPAGTAPGTLVFMDGARISIGQGLTVGRHDASKIMIDDPRVSRHHAEILPSGTTYRVTDLSSTNGTRVNGYAISAHDLADGDVVEIAGREIRFEAS